MLLLFERGAIFARDEPPACATLGPRHERRRTARPRRPRRAQSGMTTLAILPMSEPYYDFARESRNNWYCPRLKTEARIGKC